MSNITECYFDYLQDFYIGIVSLTELLNLTRLKVLHFQYFLNIPQTDIDKKKFLEQCSKIKESLQKNCVMQEIMLKANSLIHVSEEKDYISKFTISFIDGITTNRSIKSFCIDIFNYGIFINDMSMAVVSLLKDNHTLQALKLHVPEDCWKSESTLSTIEVNTPLTAVDIRGNSPLTKLIIQNCKTLLYVGPDPPFSPSDLFLSQPFLQQLDLSLSTVEQVIELFTILKCNSTLIALQANIKRQCILTDSGVGGSLKEMLEENKKMQHLEILLSEYYYQSTKFPEAYLPLMTAGLKHNSTLQGLYVPIPLSHASEQTVASFVEVISYKYNICELHMDIHYHQCDSQNDDEKNKLKSSSTKRPSDEELTELYYSLQLPFVNRILKKECQDENVSKFFHTFLNKPLQKEEMSLTFLEFMVLCHCHPSLQYIRIPQLLTEDKHGFIDQANKQGYGRFMRTHFRNPQPLIFF